MTKNIKKTNIGYCCIECGSAGMSGQRADDHDCEQYRKNMKKRAGYGLNEVGPQYYKNGRVRLDPIKSHEHRPVNL